MIPVKPCASVSWISRAKRVRSSTIAPRCCSSATRFASSKRSKCRENRITSQPAAIYTADQPAFSCHDVDVDAAMGNATVHTNVQTPTKNSPTTSPANRMVSMMNSRDWEMGGVNIVPKTTLTSSAAPAKGLTLLHTLTTRTPETQLPKARLKNESPSKDETRPGRRKLSPKPCEWSVSVRCEAAEPVLPASEWRDQGWAESC